MLNKLGVLILLSVTSVTSCKVSRATKIHSHNDYVQEVPFQKAFDNGAASIEIDVFLKNKVLYVTHYETEIVVKNTIETMYLKPLEFEIAKEINSSRQLQILIDIKSEYKTTIAQLIKTLSAYPNLVQNNKISFVISGNRPTIDKYAKFPDYILFDYQSLDDVEDPHIWDKIALISLPFHKFSKWDGESEISKKELKTIKNVIDKAHSYGKSFRFWATPDTELAWSTFAKMGVDYINTDKPAECVLYFRK